MQDQVLPNFGLSYDRLIPITRRTRQVQLSLSDLENLIEQIAQERSKQAFKKLFDFYYPKSTSFMLKAGLSKEVAKELSQDAMIKIWKNASSYSREKANVNTWIYTILRNIKFDYLRKQSRDPLSIMAATDIFDESLELEELSQEDSESIYLKAQTLEMIGKLSDDQQDVLVGIYREGLTHTEYATKANIPLGTVKSRVRLAIEKLKFLLEEK